MGVGVADHVEPAPAALGVHPTLGEHALGVAPEVEVGLPLFVGGGFGGGDDPVDDLLGQGGNVEALYEGDIAGRSEEYNTRQAEGPMSNSVPYTDETIPILEGLADLNPETLACMHGSSYNGDAGQALRDFGEILKKINGKNGA